MTNCPTCGQPLHRYVISTEQQLINAMRQPPRDVYEAYENGKRPTGRFYLTSSGGTEVAREAIRDAISRGLIVPTWPHGSAASWSLPDWAAENKRLWEERAARDASIREVKQ